ncbi:lysosome-associated membrane glycoprotein 2 isoform X2 [Scomber japonicus]|uniref:lysosome-associated membrane glycoprotein 2 isoform X2 n=1 Tax=Scomber japonicus TaxID=13676 RepID=UPI002305B65A|nr:lysosome-associated membrane glycoprotein 2 isoform X2 [Scomber japonicus]
MSRYAAFVLFLALGIELHLSHGTEVSVTGKDGKLCLYANLMVNFSVSYEVTGNTNETAEIELPSGVKSDGSTCDIASSELMLSFGEGHSWSMKFTVNEKTTYQVDSITFSYNLSDSTYFPNSLSNGTMNVTMKPHIANVGMDTCYSCKSKDMIQSDSVNQTLWNVLIQAFVSNGSKSENVTTCSADLPVTTVVPTTPTTTTTAAPNSTTIAPHNTTTPPTTIPTTTPTPTLPPPVTGKYSIKSDENSTACLLASFGLRIGFKQGDKYQEMNLDPNPNVTGVSGSCGVNSSELLLTSNTMTVMLTFANDTKKFRLHALNITGKTSSGVVFSEANSNLSLWEAAVGSSYMCNKEQNYTITNLLSIYTYNLQVQPFGVKKGVFSTAHECSLDDTSILIPIIVGAALAGLILIVVIAYVIGRRKTYVGYQTL